MALRPQVVELVRADFLYYARDTAEFGQVAVMQDELPGPCVIGDVDVVETRGVYLRSPPPDAMHLVALRQQQFREVGAILSGDAGDQSCSCHCIIGCVLPGQGRKVARKLTVQEVKTGVDEAAMRG